MFAGLQRKRHLFSPPRVHVQLLLYVPPHMFTFSEKFTGPQQKRAFLAPHRVPEKLLLHAPANMVTFPETFTGPKQKRHFCITRWDLIVSLHGQNTM